MSLRWLALAGMVLFLLMAGTAGCGEGIADCQRICTEYRDCVDDTYDVNACTNRCIDRSAVSTDFENQALGCEDCIEANVCIESFPCVLECDGVVP